MSLDPMLAELFRDEDQAREMASRLMQLAQTSAAATVKERHDLVEFVRGAMERHMSYEERAVFPQLSRRGLSPEVQVAEKQHAAIRLTVDRLATAPDEEVPQLVFDTARLLLHHTNFECDYIYPELTHEAWIELMRETVHEVGDPSGSVSTGPVTAA